MNRRKGEDLRETFIDVREFLETHTVEDLCRSAEAYFARITHWDHMLAKPFSSIQDVQHILVQFSHLIHSLELLPEIIVLDFGCGLGWASRLDYTVQENDFSFQVGWVEV